MGREFEGKTVIITGASAGVGRACAEVFAEHKANLILIARGKENLNNLALNLAEHTKVLPISLDVSDSKALSSMVKEAAETFGSIDILINNAGFHSRGPVEQKSIADLTRMIDVNIKAPIELSALVIPFMKSQGKGSIINVGSLAGRTPMEGAATYAATKAALRSFTYSLGDELRPSNIHVGLVSPGPISTGFIMDELDNVEDIVFSQPMSTARDVAQAVLKVASGSAVEICLPQVSGWLTTLSYLAPNLRRSLRPILNKKGKIAKERYRRT